MLRLDVLYVEKDRFQRFEKNMVKVNRVFLVFNLSPTVIIIAILFADEESLNALYHVLYAYNLGLISLSFLLYTSKAFNHMKDLYRYHRLEFHRHIWSKVGLIIATVFSLGSLIMYSTYQVINIFCWFMLLDLEETDDQDNIEGICVYFGPCNWSYDSLALSEFVSDMVIVLPMFIFFILN